LGQLQSPNRASGTQLFTLSLPTGGCSEPNDGVDDTAEEAQPQFGCPATPPNSCPHKPSGQPRQDPIHSYMDYSPDACMTLVRLAHDLLLRVDLEAGSLPPHADGLLRLGLPPSQESLLTDVVVLMPQFTAGQQLRMQASWSQYRSSAQQQEVVRSYEPMCPDPRYPA